MCLSAKTMKLLLCITEPMKTCLHGSRSAAGNVHVCTSGARRVLIISWQCSSWRRQWNFVFLKRYQGTYAYMGPDQHLAIFSSSLFAAKTLAMTACTMYLIDPKSLSTNMVEGLIHPRICGHRQRWRHRCPATASFPK